MKTSKYILAVSLALIFVSGYANMTVPGNAGRDLSVAAMAAGVTYVVQIENSSYLPAGAQYLVIMTDEFGRQVAPAKVFHQGVTNYTFSEGGTVRGTRVARMVMLPAKLNSLGIPPTSQTGVFYPGYGYLFVIKINNAAVEDRGLTQ